MSGKPVRRILLLLLGVVMVCAGTSNAQTLPTFATCPTFTWQVQAFKVYLGTSPTDPGVLQATIPIATPITGTWTCAAALPAGTYYVRLSEVDVNGVESLRGDPVGVVISTGPPPPPPPTFAIGATIHVTTPLPDQRLNVRATPGGTILGTQSNGAMGTIMAGPVIINGVTWWRIVYTSGPDGWCVQTYLTVP